MEWPGLTAGRFAANGNTVIVTTGDGKVLRSPDNGITWSTVISTNEDYLFAAMNGTEVYVGTSASTLLYSSDDGLHFNQKDNCPFWDPLCFVFKDTKCLLQLI